MEETLLDKAVPFFLGLVVIEAVWGRRKGVYRWNDSVGDLATGILYSLSGVLITIAALFLYKEIGMYFSVQTLFGWGEFPSGSPLQKGEDGFVFSLENLLAWGFVLIAVDFIYYWFHRATHEVHFLWACHVTHHSSEEFNLTVALRQSMFQRIFEYAFNLPLALLGIPWWMFFVCHSILKIYQFWVHTRLVGKLGWMEKILLTPSHHRVHHGRDPEYLDKNHGGILILWDKWFGTYTEEKKEPIYGLTEPLPTFNPVWANFHVYFSLWNLISRTPSWKDKILLIFKKPDWRPVSLGGEKEIPEIDRTKYRKYDPEIPNSWKIYGILQFILLAGASVYLLKLIKLGKVSTGFYLGSSIWLIFAFFLLGLLWDGRKGIWKWEGIKFLSLGLFYFF
ncbi:sterol desaturase family protein [Leptospira wolffii]|uniref:sterol desaturase family protein n=1 Tax=Leptospira wolffii TaxID=409998 RepID=UPI0003489DF2|nr:sterol desaturase family protein [Leptospira wolffii]TGK60131.1 sterol desaturase family protein [Leptospira wolffii]TGK72474.1 sterol desaturase family protein [Leptospira wolffii]TGK76138.1 sterol desaturase family protein [Leptospira wolffii]TGL30390.1 sterol desaturase family protein [Leptospira wolffii]